MTRILKTIALEPPDRTPVVLEYSGFAAYVTGIPMAEFLRAPTTNLETMIRAFEMVGDADAINYGSFWPYGLCYDYMSKVSVPGVDLPDNDMWQVVETELMTRDDYDQIINQGWPVYSKAFLAQKIFDGVPADYLPPRRKSPDALEAWHRVGVPVLSGGDVTTCASWETYRLPCCFWTHRKIFMPIAAGWYGSLAPGDLSCSPAATSRPTPNWKMSRRWSPLLEKDSVGHQQYLKKFGSVY